MKQFASIVIFTFETLMNLIYVSFALKKTKFKVVFHSFLTACGFFELFLEEKFLQAKPYYRDLLKFLKLDFLSFQENELFKKTIFCLPTCKSTGVLVSPLSSAPSCDKPRKPSKPNRNSF